MALSASLACTTPQYNQFPSCAHGRYAGELSFYPEGYATWLPPARVPRCARVPGWRRAGREAYNGRSQTRMTSHLREDERDDQKWMREDCDNKMRMH